jgi:hypothetical protein
MLTAKDMPDSELLEKLSRRLEGQKYGFLEEATGYDGCGRTQEVLRWLTEEMGS